MKMSDYHLRILAEGINNRGRVMTTLAERLYSSPETARDALISLESWGFLRLDPNTCGMFIVIKAPPEAFEMAERLKEAKQKTDENIIK